jgi:hypothetical protein
MTLFQLGSVLFSLIMLYLISVHKKKAVLSKLEMSFWALVWIGFIFIALFPQTMQSAVETLQFARLFDFLLIIALMILTILVFISYLKIREYRHTLEKTHPGLGS